MNDKDILEKKILLKELKSKNSIIETCAKAWMNQAFEGVAIGKDQELDTFRIFCIGFIQCFSLMTRVTDLLSESEGVEMMDKINSNRDSFFKKIIEES